MVLVGRAQALAGCIENKSTTRLGADAHPIAGTNGGMIARLDHKRRTGSQ